jgi:YkoY family integral membrane protein
MFHASDFVTIGILVALEGLLSADNAMVLAGIVGAFAFRITATLGAYYLIGLGWVKLGGALYLFYLAVHHFWSHAGDAEARRAPKVAKAWPGLTAFWTTVIKVELTDIVFAIDSILVAVAMSNKLWVIITGGILGVIMMRVVIGQLLALVQKYPPLVDGAFLIIGWVALKLFLEFLHAEGWIAFEMPRWLSLGLIGVIFLAAFLYAKKTAGTPGAPVSRDAP